MEAGGAEAGGEEVFQGFDVTEVGGAAEVVGDPAELAAAESGGEGGGGQKDGVAVGEGGGNEFVEEEVFVAGDGGGAGELGGEVGVPVADE